MHVTFISFSYIIDYKKQKTKKQKRKPEANVY